MKFPNAAAVVTTRFRWVDQPSYPARATLLNIILQAHAGVRRASPKSPWLRQRHRVTPAFETPDVHASEVPLEHRL
eukprot:840231-Pleurochrysis_carterae.AAC.5